MTRALALLLAVSILAPASLAQTRSATPASDDASRTEAPDFLTYSGILTDADGAPLADGTYALTFRGYATEATAEPTWQERHDATVTAGQFWVVLGRHTPLAAGADWYTVSVDGAPESQAVQLAGGSESAGFAPGNTLDQSYENGAVINIDQGRPLVFRGTPGSFYTGLQIQNITATFTGDELVRFRLRSVNGGASWEYRVYGAQSTGPTAPPPGSFAISNASNPGAIDPFVILPNATQDLLRLTGNNVTVGSPTSPSELEAYTTDGAGGPGNGVVTYRLDDRDGDGSRSTWYTDTGSIHTRIEPDGSGGEGGIFTVVNGTGGPAFQVDGNNAVGSFIRIGEGAGGAVFSTGLTGSSTVRLPVDAIQASEVLDEAGTANATNDFRIALAAGNQVTLARTITVPASGFVLVYGTAELQTSHTTGANSFTQFAVSRDCDASPTAPVTQGTNTQLPASLPSGTYGDIVTVHGLFSVTAGVHTFCNFVQQINSTAGFIDDQNLTLIYVPTAYGTVASNVGRGSDSDLVGDRESQVTSRPLTAADVASERAASISANEARVADELRAMRERIAELEATMGNGDGR